MQTQVVGIDLSYIANETLRAFSHLQLFELNHVVVTCPRQAHSVFGPSFVAVSKVDTAFELPRRRNSP